MPWKRGQWNVICDVCGFNYYSGELRKRWDGLMVCKQDFETRHPQEFVRSVKESTIPWTRPEPDGINISANEYVDAFYYAASDPVNNLPGEYTNQLGI